MSTCRKIWCDEYLNFFEFMNVYNIISDFSLTKFLEEQKESLSDGLSSAERH
jgi:hypothetical protein